jgi:putative membrane protein
MTKYDPHDWLNHLFDIRGSLLREISLRVITCVGWSIVVVLVHANRQSLGFDTVISSIPHSLIGAALSLLLVFRTNASYDRFWEGRKLWGSIVNESRNLGRSVSALLGREPTLANETIRWGIVFPWAAARQLRGMSPEGPHLDEFTPAEQALVSKSRQPWLAAARQITQRLQSARDAGLLTDIQFQYADQNVQILVDNVGGCQRIHNTPLPYAYMVHLRRALIIYAYTLPLALVDAFESWTVLVTLLITYTLFGIEEIGVEIEDPFGDDENDLPLADICATIEADLKEMLVK